MMKRIYLVLIGFVLVGCCASCCHDDVNPLFGHWGCETYISCRTSADGTERWDTLTYEVGTNRGYELWFNDDGSGKLKLNESPALIKEFSVTYELDEAAQQIVIHGSTWLFVLYGSAHLDENEVRFDLESLDDNAMTVSWTNVVSESEPFFERFFLKKIL